MIGWAIGAVILAVAAASLWFAFQSPTFVAGLAALAAGAAWKAIEPTIAKRRTPEEEKALHRAERAGEEAQLERKRRGFPPKG